MQLLVGTDVGMGGGSCGGVRRDSAVQSRYGRGHRVSGGTHTGTHIDCPILVTIFTMKLGKN